ncbi:HAD domain-containing protein [Pseudomonas saliphila]|uniref:HAD domain-containing protein n=1 Tax=Pseudomonas saliphila TaxID=2586906 RepID=UPI0015B4CBA9|nr:HAD domain-containing protein [Pseudomonas saliphila]
MKTEILIFLDYDGVLHPDAVYRRLNGHIELRAPGELFMWAPVLIEALAPYPDLSIVLSTSWVRELGFRRALAFLPAHLAERVIGGTWHSAMSTTTDGIIEWDQQSRYDQISAHLNRQTVAMPWLAIDDDAVGWPSGQHQSLVHTDPMLGLSSTETQLRLQEKLRALNVRNP